MSISTSTGDQNFTSQPKLTREYFMSRKRYVATTPARESVMESGVPSLVITSANVVCPGTIKATSFCVSGVFRVIRTTLQPTTVAHVSAHRSMRQSLDHEPFISFSKRPESELKSVRALCQNDVLDNTFTFTYNEQVIASDGNTREINENEKQATHFGVISIVLKDVSTVYLKKPIGCAE